MAHKMKKSRRAVFGEMLPLIKAEAAGLSASSLPEPDRYAGSLILNETYAAAKAADEKEVKALLLGYSYFAAVTGRSEANIEKIFALIEEL